MQNSGKKETRVFLDGGRLRVRVDPGTVAILLPAERSRTVPKISLKSVPIQLD